MQSKNHSPNPPEAVVEVVEGVLRAERRRGAAQVAGRAAVGGVFGLAALLGLTAMTVWLGWWPHPVAPTTRLLLPAWLGLAWGLFVLGTGWKAWRGTSRRMVAHRLDQFLPNSADRFTAWVELRQNPAFAADPFAHWRTTDLGRFLEHCTRQGPLHPPWLLPPTWWPALLALAASVVWWHVAIGHSVSRQMALQQSLALLQNQQDNLARGLAQIAGHPEHAALAADVAHARAHLQETLHQLATAQGFRGVTDPHEETQVALASAAAVLQRAPDPLSSPDPAWADLSSLPAGSTDAVRPIVGSVAPPELVSTQPFLDSDETLQKAEAPAASATPPDSPEEAAGLREELLAGLQAATGLPTAPVALPKKSWALSRPGQLRAAANEAPGTSVVMPWQEGFQPDASGEHLPLPGPQMENAEVQEGRGTFPLAALPAAVGQEVRSVLTAAEKFPSEAASDNLPQVAAFLAQALPRGELPPTLPPRTRGTVQRYFERLRWASGLSPLPPD